MSHISFAVLLFTQLRESYKQIPPGPWKLSWTKSSSSIFQWSNSSSQLNHTFRLEVENLVLLQKDLPNFSFIFYEHLTSMRHMCHPARMEKPQEEKKEESHWRIWWESLNLDQVSVIGLYKFTHGHKKKQTYAKTQYTCKNRLPTPSAFFGLQTSRNGAKFS